MLSPRRVIVKVRSLAFGGEGVGEVIEQALDLDSLLGISAFIPFTIPGEIVEAEVKEQKDRYIRADLKNVLTTSEERQAPLCPYFGICGGCELQHIKKEAQLKHKFSMLQSAMKAAKLPEKAISCLKPIYAANDYGYRRRITLHIDANGKIGFYKTLSRSIVPISSCLVATSGINFVLANIASLGEKLKGQVSSLILEEDENGVTAVLKTVYDLSISAAQSILDVAKDYFENCSLVSAEKEVCGIGRRILELPLNTKNSFSLRVPAGSFSQINWEINIELISRVCQEAKVSYDSFVYDLYAGAGNFSLPLALAGAKVTAVETDERLIAFGRENASRYNLKINFIQSSVEKLFSPKNKEKPEAYPLIIADPPRSGLGQLASQLNFAKKLLLISCHQPSLIRDLKNLTQNGWELGFIQAYEMFPQTSYMEVLSVLTKAKRNCKSLG